MNKAIKIDAFVLLLRLIVDFARKLKLSWKSMITFFFCLPSVACFFLTKRTFLKNLLKEFVKNHVKDMVKDLMKKAATELKILIKFLHGSFNSQSINLFQQLLTLFH